MAEPSPLRARLEVALRVLAALVGTAGPALYAAIALARFLPASEETRFIVGFLLFGFLSLHRLRRLFCFQVTQRGLSKVRL